MTQHELDRDLARVTGESARCIRTMGFTLLVMPGRTARKARKRSIAEQVIHVGPASKRRSGGD
jgi:hypothetical protein